MAPAIRNDTQTAAPATAPAAPSSAKISAPTIAPTPMKAACRTVRYFCGGAETGLSVSSISAMSSFSRSPGVWLVSAVGRDGRRLAHVAALSQVDGDAEQQRTGSQEERRPVDPEAVAGVARVPDEQDREDQCQYRDGHVPDEARGLR